MNIKSIFTDEDFINLTRVQEGVGIKFNIFSVLGQADYEIKHSNVISWLLNHKGSHELKDIFINKFIELLRDIYNINIVLNINNSVVYREKYYIDIIIEDSSNKVIVAIENKFGSQESYQQLLQYRKRIEKVYKDYQQFYIFLTPLGNQYSSDRDNWIQISYKDIYSIILNIVNICKFKDQNISEFLKMYLELIDSRLFGNIQGKYLIEALLKRYNTELENLSIENIINQYQTYINSISKGKSDLYIETLQVLINTHGNVPIILRDYAWEQLYKNSDPPSFRRLSSIGFSTYNLKSIIKENISQELIHNVLYYLSFGKNEVIFSFAIYPPNKEQRKARNALVEWIKDNPPTSNFANRREYDYYIIYEAVVLSKEDFLKNNLDSLKIKLVDKINNMYSSTIKELELYISNYS